MRPTALGLALLFTLPTPPGADMMTLGEVLVFNVPEVAPDAGAAFEAHVLDSVIPAWTTGRGAALHLLRADRGAEKGRYVVAWTFDTAARRREHTQAGRLPSGVAPFVTGPGLVAEYHLVGPGSVGAMPEVEILGVHCAKVRPERRAAFERFVRETVHPAVAHLRPDLRLLYYKAVSGPDAGDYIAVFGLTVASRDKYWPGGSDSDELRAAFAPLGGLKSALSAYLVEGSYLADQKFAAAVFESRDWTDFVRVSRARSTGAKP